MNKVDGEKELTFFISLGPRVVLTAEWLERRFEKTHNVIKLLAKAMEPAQDLAWPVQHSGKKAGMPELKSLIGKWRTNI